MIDERHEIVVSRDGVSIEWWCATAMSKQLAQLHVLAARADSGDHKVTDEYRASGITFKEVPHDMNPGLHLIRRRDE